jgi:hypothetical protein
MENGIWWLKGFGAIKRVGSSHLTPSRITIVLKLKKIQSIYIGMLSSQIMQYISFELSF